MTRKRQDRSTTSRSDGFASPFAKLEQLRAALPEGDAPEEQRPSPAPRQGKVVVRREKKGRGGKMVTIVEGIEARSLEALAGELKRELGCGANLEGTAVVLAGDQEERVKASLEARGFTDVVLGTRR